MKISEYFNLKLHEEDLDFYDVELDSDNYRFIDAYYLKTLEDEFSIESQKYIDSFFQDFLVQLGSGDFKVGKGLFTHLHEINNTRLGMSEFDPNGKGIGKLHAEQIYNAIVKSDLFTNGVTNDFEDIGVYVKWIDKDKMSDMITNIIKEKLIDFTQKECKKHNILTKKFEVEYWSLSETGWKTAQFELPFDSNNKFLLFVPKHVLVIHTHYNFGEFLYKAILPFYKDLFIAEKHPIVKEKKLKDGSVSYNVNKKDVLKELQKKEEIDKNFAITFTKEHPEVLNKFKREKFSKK